MENSVSSANSSMSSTVVNDQYRYCTCGALSMIKISMTERNPGRRFIGCGRYDGSSKHCDFFVWYDPPTTKFAGKVLTRLAVKNEKLLEEVNSLKEKIEALQQNMAAEKAEKELLALKVESSSAEAKKLKIVIVCMLFLFVAGKWFGL